jgi:hypothetical protein
LRPDRIRLGRDESGPIVGLIAVQRLFDAPFQHVVSDTIATLIHSFNPLTRGRTASSRAEWHCLPAKYGAESSVPEAAMMQCHKISVMVWVLRYSNATTHRNPTIQDGMTQVISETVIRKGRRSRRLIFRRSRGERQSPITQLTPES